MRGWTLLVVGLGVLLAVSSAGIGLAQDDRFVRGEPDLDVYAPEPGLSPGSTQTVSLQVANGGEAEGAIERRAMVTTARNVRVRAVADDAPFDIETQRQSIGPVPDGEVRTVPITVSAPADIEPGTYSVDVELRYSHTSVYAPRSGVVQERSPTTTETVTLRVAEGPRFELEGDASNIQVGGSGTVDVRVENIGTEPATDVDIALESTSPYLSFDGGAADTGRIDRLEPGETMTVPFGATLQSGATDRAYSFDGRVRYTDNEGIRTSQEGLSAGFVPLGEQSFDLRVEESTLRVGQPGVIHGEITNEGPAAVRDVVVELGEGQFEPRTRSYAIGELNAGESASFRFRVTVPHGADSVPQRIDITTRHRLESDGRTSTQRERTSTDSIHVSVADRRDAISVTPVEPRFAAGESGTLVLDLRNQRDDEVREVRVQLDVSDPLDSEFRSAVIPRLSAGETDRVAFDIEVDSDAPVSQYPATVSVEYLDADDEAASVRPTTVAVQVVETDDAFDLGIEILVFLVVVLSAVGVFIWLYRR